MDAADQLNSSVEPFLGQPDDLTRQQGSMQNLEYDTEGDQSPRLFMAEEDDDVAMLQASGVVGNDAILGTGNLEKNKLFVSPPAIDIRFEQMMDSLMEEDYLGRLMENSKPEFMMEIDIESLGPPAKNEPGRQDVEASASSNLEPDLGINTSDFEVVSSTKKAEDVPIAEETNLDGTVSKVTVKGVRCQRQKRRNTAVDQAVVELVPKTKKPMKSEPGTRGGRGRGGQHGTLKSDRGNIKKNEALVPQEVANAFEPKLLQVRPPRKWSAPRPIPEEEKDDTYKIKRQINTEAARRSREKKRKIDQQRVQLIQWQVSRIQELEQEVEHCRNANKVLRDLIQGEMMGEQQEIQQPLALPAPPQKPKGKKRGNRRNK